MSLGVLTAALADRYRIERELGHGGMATVYLSQDLWHHFQVTIIILMIAGCSDSAPAKSANSTAVAAADADSIARSAATDAATLRDSAQATLATLLDNPASATFDSVVVIQPPPVNGRSPAPAVCGRIGGQPGIGGRSTPTRFVYQGRWTVFVEEAGNQKEFATVWAKLCEAP